MPKLSPLLEGITRCLQSKDVDEDTRKAILMRVAQVYLNSRSRRNQRYAEKRAAGWTRVRPIAEIKRDTERRRLARAKLRAAGLPYT